MAQQSDHGTPADSASSSAAQQAAMQAMMVQITTDGVPKLHCPVCNKALVSLNGYVRHLKKHEAPGGFVCRYCTARFCTEDDLKRHRDAEHTTIACRLCKDQLVTFLNEQDYREHIRTAHNGIDREMYTCAKCGAEYKTPEPYRRHMDTECGTIKPHKCDQCEMAFVTKYNLKQHKESHSGERKFCCSYCGKNFLQKGRLVEHERSHTGEKPYKCDVCGKSFAHRESIVTHSSIHTGIRLVECKCCQSRFSCYSNLIKHRRTRPETCGLPEYDPPKNRVRTHRSRIPPTLNPTSEIKVSSLNKIIKPHDKEQQLKKLLKKELNSLGLTDRAAKSKPTARKRTGLPAKRKIAAVATARRRDKSKIDSDNAEGVSEHTTTEEDSDDDDDDATDSKRQTRNATVKQSTASSERKTVWSDVDSDEDIEDEDYVDPADDSEDEDDDYKASASPALKLAAHLIKEEQNDKQADGSRVEEFEYNDPCEYVDAELFNVKSEDPDVNSIFNEKDKLLDCLLNEEADALAPASFVKVEHDGCGELRTTTPPSDALDTLQETEVVIVKNEHGESFNEEDILDVKTLTNPEEIMKCKIMLEDITLRYPKLREASSIKVGRNAKLQALRAVRNQSTSDADADPDAVKPAKRVYRRRGDVASSKSSSSGPKRTARISQQELKERLRMLKKEGRSWQCPNCIKIYHMRKPFEKHLREDHNRDELEIKQLLNADDALAPLLRNEDIFKCQICDKIYLVEKRLLAHIRLHGDDGRLIFKCPCYCSVYFASREEAQMHAQQQHRELLYCELCQKFMTGHDSLKNHMRHHHQSVESERKADGSDAPTAAGGGSGSTSSAAAARSLTGGMKRNLVCDKCGKKFSGRTSLTDHVRSDCGRKPLYPCTVCGKHLTTAGILKTHLLLHKDETPFQCDQCGKTFKVKAQYKTHLKTRHSDNKPFKCHLCPKAYPYRESLLTHMTVHTGIKRFLCNGCGKRFTCISNLQAHRKVHAESCGLLPLNAKATQYMGVQKGNLLLGAKPEAGLDYIETNTLIAREVLDRDLPMAQELNFPSEPSAPLATVPLNYAQALAQPHLALLPQILSMTATDGSVATTRPFGDESHHSHAFN